MLVLFGVGIAGCSRSSTESPQAMATIGRFTFDGQEEEISVAEIVATLPDPYWFDTYNNGEAKSLRLRWSIRIVAKEREIEGELLSPHVDFDGLDNLKIANWHDLVGITVSWSEPINDETGERYGMTYVWDHQLITNGKLRITDRDGTTFRVIASGENEQGQSFSIDAPVKFVGVIVHASGRDSDEQVRERLSKHLSLTNVKPAPLEFRDEDKYEDGMKMGSALYTPIE
jgi:hypothetical protein